MISIQMDRIELSSINSKEVIIWEREVPMNLILDRSQTLRQRLEEWYHQQINSISNDEPINWPNYIIGILSQLIDRMNKQPIPLGFNIVVISDVPSNKGVASSAALEIAIASAGND